MIQFHLKQAGSEDLKESQLKITFNVTQDARYSQYDFIQGNRSGEVQCRLTYGN